MVVSGWSGSGDSKRGLALRVKFGSGWIEVEGANAHSVAELEPNIYIKKQLTDFGALSLSVISHDA